MATFDLSRLNILLVEDSTFMQSLFSRVLRCLDVRQLTVVSDGAEAIHVLKQFNTVGGGFSGNTRPINVVISDWVMRPVDGKMLLQWIRTHKDSPDPFLPFIMLSGLSEPERVKEARELGANEFLAKPFSLNSIATKLTALIEKPRNFIITPTYFGPDRRRSQQPIDFENRRVIKKEELKILQSGHIKANFADGVKAYYIKNPNDLRRIVVGLGNHGEPGYINGKFLAAASLELENMASDYADWVKLSVGKLYKIYEELLTLPKNHFKYFSEINMLAHELRGQGDTFGYPLITIFGKSLFEYTNIHMEKLDNDFIELLKAHINLLEIIIRDKINGDGGDMGKSIRQALAAAKHKYETEKN